MIGTNKAPDFSQLADLALQYGKSGAGKPSLLEQTQSMQMLQNMFNPQRQPTQQLPNYPVYPNYGRGPRQLQQNVNNAYGGGRNFGDFIGTVNQQISGGNRGNRQPQPQQPRRMQLPAPTTGRFPDYQNQGELFPSQNVGQGELFPALPGQDYVEKYARRGGQALGQFSNFLGGLF